MRLGPLVAALSVAASWCCAPANALAGVEHQLSVGASRLDYAFFATPARYGPFVAYHLAVGRADDHKPYLLGGGLRFAAPFGRAVVPLEGYLQAHLAARVGAWTPELGPEFGVTGFGEQSPRFPRPADHPASRGYDIGPLYVGFNLEPLQFRIGRFSISALDLQVGTMLEPVGSVLRFQAGLHVGAVL